MSRHHRALRLIADARPAVLDDRTERAVPRFAEPPSPAPRPRRRFLLAGLAPTVAVAVAAAVLVVSTLDTETPGPGADPARAVTAQDLLLAAAERAATGTGGTGAFWVTKVEQRHLYDVGDYTVTDRTEVETWRPLRGGGSTVLVIRPLGAAPTTDADRTAWKADGSPTTWTVPSPEGKPGRTVESAPGARKVAAVPGTGFELVGRSLSYEQLQALPTDAAALRAYLTDAEAAARGSFRPDDLPAHVSEMLFLHSRSLLTDLPVPAGVRAATYRMLAGLDGLTLTENIRDAQGRPGAGISRTMRNAGGDTVTLRLVIDAGSGSLLAVDDRTGSTLLLGDRFTDEQPPRS